MKLGRALALFALAVSLVGCAGSVSAPIPLQPLPVEQKAGLHISDVTAEAAPGVAMAKYDFERICDKVKAELAAADPGVMTAGGAPSAVTMKFVFTRYDKGSAFARAMLAGLGQIRINAKVLLVNADGSTAAQYLVSKDFSFGGVVGAATSIEDVEDGFSKSVAEIVKQKSA